MQKMVDVSLEILEHLCMVFAFLKEEEVGDLGVRQQWSSVGELEACWRCMEPAWTAQVFQTSAGQGTWKGKLLVDCSDL